MGLFCLSFLCSWFFAFELPVDLTKMPCINWVQANGKRTRCLLYILNVQRCAHLSRAAVKAG